MKRAVMGATLALSVLSAGCGGGGNVQDYCRRGVDALCSRLFACDSQAAGQEFGSQSGCVSQLGTQCSNTECPGGTSFDQSAADQCVAAYSSANCSDLQNGIFPSVCSQVCK
jgi:hypothetical protein